MNGLLASAASLILAVTVGQMLLVSPVAGQTKEQLGVPDLESLRSTLGAPARPLETTEAVSVDAPVKAEEYVVGPGDRLALNVWSSTPVEERLTVTPEGLLIIPGVRTVDVRDLTLAQVKAKVSSLVGRKYLNAEISIALLVPRKVSVTILGQVPNEGKKNVYASQRVEDLIALGNEFPTGRMDADQYADKLNQMRARRSERKIVLQHRGGERRIVDLVRYRITGSGQYNPYLQEGDVVYVPNRTDYDNVLSIFGGAIQHANFEFVDGDSLSTLVSMGMGFQMNAEPAHAVLSRLSPDGMTMETIPVNALAILEGRAPDIALRPGDRLVVPVLPVMAANYYVTVQGEVKRPGTYPITRDGTKLSDIIRQAGGFSERVNLNGGLVYRTKVGEIDASLRAERERMLSLRASLSFQDTSYYHVESMLRLTEEQVVVDFRGLFERGDSTCDVTLRALDRIVIPEKQHTVYVFGQVVSPGHVLYKEGEGYKHYVERAGGLTNDARSGDVKVIKGGTRAWLDPGETSIEDGDLIWVPKDRDFPFSYYVNTYAQIAGIIGTVATVALLINTMK